MSFLAQFRPQPTVDLNGSRGERPFTWTDFTGGGLGYAEAALTREVDEVVRAPQGQRNHTLNAAAFSLGQLVAGGAIGRERVFDALMGAGRLAGLTRVETERTIASGLRAGAAQPREVPERPGLIVPAGSLSDLSADSQTDSGQVPDEGAWVREHLPAVDWRELWEREDAEEWIVEPLLPARRLVALYSAPKVGKSLLMLELAVKVSRAEYVLGYQPDRARRVLYVDFENDPAGDVRERLKAMGYGPADLDNLVYLSFPKLATLDSPAGGLQLLAAVREYGCEVVVVDTISRAIQGEENENDTWLAFYRHTGKALKAEGVSLIRLDHAGKDETKGQRGGSAKSGDVDMVWRMSRVTDSVYRLDCEAARMPVIEKTLVLDREVTPRLTHRVQALGRAAAWEAKVRATCEALDGLGLPMDIGRDKARDALRAIGFSASTEVLTEVVRTRKASMTFSAEPVREGRGQVPFEDLSERSTDRSGQVVLP